MKSTKPRRSQAQRSETMRNALMDAAYELFVEKGYAETGTPEIVKKAGVTRGALYHHFSDKRDLLRAVVMREAMLVADRITADTREVTSTRDALIKGSNAYFAAMADSGRSKILLLEGPAVLGRAEMDLIDQETGGDTLREGLAFGQRMGELVPMPVEAMAAMLSAVFDRAALAIAYGEPQEPYRRAVSLLIDGLITTDAESG